MIALIQAGGAGTRLKNITGDLPKPMVSVGGKPILQWQIENLVRDGVEDIFLVVGPGKEVIQNYFGDGDKFHAHISYIEENEPLGTGGALYYASKKFHEDFILCFGDLMLDIDFKKMVAFHKKKKSIITTFAHPNSHPYDSDILWADAQGKVLRIFPKKETRDFFYRNLTNAGIYVVSKELLSTFSEMDRPMKLDFERDLLSPTLMLGGVYAYRSSEYVKDCGTPDRYESVNADINSGVVFAKNLSRPQRCVFLDRDGTINRFGDFVTTPDKLELFPYAGKAIARLNRSPYLAICVTNQPIIARGEADLETLDQIHGKLEVGLGNDGAYLDDLYFCPHHPDKGFPGERVEYKIHCNCRKPNIGMLLKAKAKYNIDFASSWMVGDTLQDVMTGINAGCKTILLTTGDPRPSKKYENAKPDYICKTLEEAVDIILGEKEK